MGETRIRAREPRNPNGVNPRSHFSGHLILVASLSGIFARYILLSTVVTLLQSSLPGELLEPQGSANSAFAEPHSGQGRRTCAGRVSPAGIARSLGSRGFGVRDFRNFEPGSPPRRVSFAGSMLRWASQRRLHDRPSTRAGFGVFSISCDFAISQSSVPTPLGGCHPTPIACMKWRLRNSRNSFDSYCTVWAGVGKIVHCMKWIGRATLAGLRRRVFFERLRPALHRPPGVAAEAQAEATTGRPGFSSPLGWKPVFTPSF